MMGMVVFSLLITATGAATPRQSGLLEKQKLASQAGHRCNLAIGHPREILEGSLAINHLSTQ